MNYHDIRTDNMLNGDGLRVVLFVSGCEHHCLSCHNPQTWDAGSGEEFTSIQMDYILTQLKHDYIDGLTLTGGDPMFYGNREKVLYICKKVKELFPQKTIWLYTGYTYSQIQNEEILNYIDVLVDGKFEIDKVDKNYKWAGSTNQRVMDIQKTLNTGVVEIYE